MENGEWGMGNWELGVGSWELGVGNYLPQLPPFDVLTMETSSLISS